LLNIQPGEKIVASQLSGDFILPKEKNKKLVFIAGGIGVTPFRSMIKYLIDKKEKRDITIFYSQKTFNDFAYVNDLDEAEKELGIKTIYTLTEKNLVPTNWNGETGFIDMTMIKKYISDYNDRCYFLSGPHTMVVNFEKTLKNIGIKNSRIIKDFFPGFV